MPLEAFILGTGTEVGKSFVGRLMVQALRQQGRQVWVHKPIACGSALGSDLAEDAVLWHGLADPDQDLARVCPLSFPEACAPSFALERRGLIHTTAMMADTIQSLRGTHDLIVEGAGGLLSPLSSDGDNADLARRCGLPLVLVGSSVLGGINAARLTIREIRRQNLPLVGLILNRTNDSDQDLSRITTLLAHEAPLIGLISQDQQCLPRSILDAFLPS